MSDLPEEREVILGVDTHLDVHVAVLIDVVGRVVATTSVSDDGFGLRTTNRMGTRIRSAHPRWN